MRANKIPDLSIIIPHYNHYSIIDKCLHSLQKITYQDYEIIVIDNNSTDNSYQLLRKHFKEINLIKSDSNLGYAGGCNLGAQHAKGKYLLFLNNDTVHSPNFIEPLISFLNHNEKAISVAAHGSKSYMFF